MFDNKVDIVSVYGNVMTSNNVIKLKGDIDTGVKKLKRRIRYTRSGLIYKEYQAMRKTDDFWAWWRKQYARQHALCYYCKESLKIKRVNVEHIVPMSRGGTNNKKNMVLSCSDCNKEKGSKLLKKSIRKELRLGLIKQVRDDQRSFRIQKEKDTLIAEELREMF